MRSSGISTDLVELTETAMVIALSVVLGSIRLLELPSGGSIGFGTIPILAYAVSRGARAGCRAGICAGLAHAMAGGTIVHPVQALLDYGVAYAGLGLAGLGGARWMRPSIVLASLTQLAAFTVSGMVFFASSAPMAALPFALTYNAVTVLPELAIALLLVPAAVRAIARANPADGWRRGLLEPPQQTRPPGSAAVAVPHPTPRGRPDEPRVTDSSPRLAPSPSAPAEAAPSRVRLARPAIALPRVVLPPS